MMEPSSSPATSPSTPSTPLFTMAKEDLPALFSQMEDAVAALEPSPPNSPGVVHNHRDHHDSDDDMEQEEERLHDSSEKLRSLMMMRRGAGQRYDEYQAKSSSLDPNANVPRQLIFDAVGATSSSLCPTSALDIDVSSSSSPPSCPSSLHGYSTPLRCAPTTDPSSSLSASYNGTTSTSSSTPAQLQYWDCTDHQREGTPMSPTRTAGFATPLALKTPEQESIIARNDEKVENLCLRRVPSAFPLPSAGEEDLEVLGDVAVDRRAGGDDNENSTDIIRIQASSSIASSLASIISCLPPASSTRERSVWGEEDKDMHEVGCASRCLSELSIQQRFFGLRDVASGEKCNDKSSFSVSKHVMVTSAWCRHLAFIALRPDVPCGDISDLVTEVLREQGLIVRKRQGSHIVGGMKVVDKEGQEKGGICGNGIQAEWSFVDIQVALDRQDRERVLLVRFIISTETEEGGYNTDCKKIMTPSMGRRSSVAGVEGGSDEQGTLLEALKAKLFGSGLNKRALLRDVDANVSSSSSSKSSKSITLDPQYLHQLEDLAREDMHRTLEATARNLEEYVCAAEEKCEQLRLLMEPMYLQYKLEKAPSIAKALPLSFYPLDLLAADGTMGGDEQISLEEKTLVDDRLAYIDALKETAWRCCLMQCDAEMTARMQRKNLQVLDRMAKCTEYQRLLIANLRDNERRTSVPLFQAFKNQIGHDGGIYDDEDVETPLYYCRCIIGSRPATLFMTYEHLAFVSNVPGFGWSRQIRYDEISTCGLASLRIGITLAKAIAIRAPTARVASPMPVKRPGGASGKAAPRSSCSRSIRTSAAVASRKAEEESLVFSTMIEPERLLDLIKLLITLNDGNIKDAASMGSELPSEEGRQNIQEQASSNLARELEAASPFLVN